MKGTVCKNYHLQPESHSKLTFNVISPSQTHDGPSDAVRFLALTMAASLIE